MTSRKKDEFVSLYGLILWLLEKELNSNVDICKAYNNVGHHLTRLFIHNKYCSFFRITMYTTTGKEQISKLPDGAIQVIADFLKKIKNKQGSNCLYYYEIALRDLDLILATPSMNISALHQIEATPNYGLYKEIGNIVKTFMNSRVVTDHVELFLSSLLRRWGNPKVYRYYVESIEDFKTAEFVKSDFSNTVFGIVLNSDFINLNQNVGKSTLEIDQLKKENEKLKAELAEKEQKIKEQESLSCKKDTDLLSLIFDETKRERYSPDLVLAVKLWEHVYIANPKDDSHSNKAVTWLKANTGYDVNKKAGSASKIREITAPLINWSTHRDKAYKK